MSERQIWFDQGECLLIANDAGRASGGSLGIGDGDGVGEVVAVVVIGQVEHTAIEGEYGDRGHATSGRHRV